MIIDLHNHAEYSRDTTLKLFDYINWGRAMEISFGITEHDFLYPNGGEFDGVRIFPGMELLNKFGDYVIFGADKNIADLKDIFEIIMEVHKQGGVVIAAHPFRQSGVCNMVGSKNALDILMEVDAIEVNGRSNQQSQTRVLEIARNLGKPVVGGSDAHNESEIARVATKISGNINSVAELVNAIKEGNCQAVNLQENYYDPIP